MPDELEVLHYQIKALEAERDLLKISLAQIEQHTWNYISTVLEKRDALTILDHLRRCSEAEDLLCQGESVACYIEELNRVNLPVGGESAIHARNRIVTCAEATMQARFTESAHIGSCTCCQNNSEWCDEGNRLWSERLKAEGQEHAAIRAYQAACKIQA